MVEFFFAFRKIEEKINKRFRDSVSPQAKALIDAMLTLDPKERITAQAALKSPFISVGANKNSNYSFNLKIHYYKSIYCPHKA
jgi:serine/threonine protein kinase